MFCLDCQEKVLYKHQDKCSILLQTKNRSLTTNKIITPILMTYQLELMEFLYNQIIIQKKSSCFFLNYYFHKWQQPTSPDQSIANMIVFAGLLSTLIKMVSIIIPSELQYFSKCHMNGYCFYCNIKCTKNVLDVISKHVKNVTKIKSIFFFVKNYH